MPYSGIDDQTLPPKVKALPKKLCTLWIKIFNDSKGDDKTSAAKAWAIINNMIGNP